VQPLHAALGPRDQIATRPSVYDLPADGLSPVDHRVQALSVALLTIATVVDPRKLGKKVVKMVKSLWKVAVPAAQITVLGSTAIGAAPR